MKYCSKCKIEKPKEEFHKALRSKDGHQSICKACRKEWDARIYVEGGEEYRRRKKERERDHARANARLVLHYLREHPCVDCGETDPIVLQFDHVKGQKRYNLGDLTRINVASGTVMAEIEKCEVRCANCHQRKTAARQGTVRYRYLLSLEQEPAQKQEIEHTRA